MAKEYNVVVTKENVSKFLDGVLDFIYANRPQEYSVEFQASINELPRYAIHVEGIPLVLSGSKEVTDETN